MILSRDEFERILDQVDQQETNAGPDTLLAHDKAQRKEIEHWKEEGLNAIHSIEMVLDERDEYKAALEELLDDNNLYHAGKVLEVVEKALEAK